MATWDIDGVRDQAKHRIGQHVSHLHLAASKEGTWEVDSAYCPQNYGYSIINLNTTAPGTIVKAYFKGIAGAKGYRAINIDKAGWRYGFVAYSANGTRTYGKIESDKEGTASLTIPEDCKKLFFRIEHQGNAERRSFGIIKSSLRRYQCQRKCVYRHYHQHLIKYMLRSLVYIYRQRMRI